MPLAGFVILALAGGRLSKRAIAIIGTGTIAISTIIAFVIGINFIISPPAGTFIYTDTLDMDVGRQFYAAICFLS